MLELSNNTSKTVEQTSSKNSMNDYTEDFTNKTVNFMRKMVHRVGACTGNTDANPCMSGLYFQEESTGIQYYSRTSDNGPSEKRTTSLQRTHSVLRIEITIVVILKQPPRSSADKIQTPNGTFQYKIASK